MNRNLATQDVAPAVKHFERYDIDWSNPPAGDQPEPLSWRTRVCYCKTPWGHQ